MFSCPKLAKVSSKAIKLGFILFTKLKFICLAIVLEFPSETVKLKSALVTVLLLLTKRTSLLLICSCVKLFAEVQVLPDLISIYPAVLFETV